MENKTWSLFHLILSFTFWFVYPSSIETEITSGTKRIVVTFHIFEILLNL